MSRLKLFTTVAAVLRMAGRPGAPGISERVDALPRLVRATVDGSYAGTTVKRLGLVVAAVAYVASPVDLLPEALMPVLGMADDAVVASWAIKALLEETDRFLAWELGQGRRPGRTVVPGTVVGEPPAPQQRANAAGERDAPPAAGLREAATTYLLESVRRRLER